MLLKNSHINKTLRFIFLKKIILFIAELKKEYKSNFTKPFFFYKYYYFCSSLKSKKYESFELFKADHFLLNYFCQTELTDFFFYQDTEKHILTITISFSKRNFFLSTATDFRWPLFKILDSPIYTSVFKHRNFFINGTLSSGEINQPKQAHTLFETFNVAKELTCLVVSTFWSLLNHFIVKQFSIVVRLKSSSKYINSIIYWVRKHFKQLYYDHLKYIIKYKSASKLLSENSISINSIKYKHSLLRLKAIKDCPLYFDFVEFIRKQPHNGCKSKKYNRKRKS